MEILQKRDEFKESYNAIDSEIRKFEVVGKEWMSETAEELLMGLNELEDLCRKKFEEGNLIVSLKERFEEGKDKLVDSILDKEEVLEYLSSELSACAEQDLLHEIQEKVGFCTYKFIIFIVVSFNLMFLNNFFIFLMIY